MPVMSATLHPGTKDIEVSWNSTPRIQLLIYKNYINYFI